MQQKLGYESLFQSTHPVGGATDGERQPAGNLPISIHAPRGGCDAAFFKLDKTEDLFQSTHPVGGATPSTHLLRTRKHISIHAPRGGCDSKSAQNPLYLLRQNQERSFDKRENRLKGRPFDGENPHKPMRSFRILPFAGYWKVRTSRGFPGSFTFAQAENILHSPCYTIKTSLGR